MDKSNDGTEKQGSRDEDENQKDDQATTSKVENSPERNAHNMNDFKSLDFNSADEVRQAMKAVLSGKNPPPPFSEEANNKIKTQSNKPEALGINQMGKNSHNYELRKTVQKQDQQKLNLKIMSTAQTYTGDSSRSTAINKRGGSMKAGPSRLVRRPRSIRRPRKSVLYIGKLSNVVQFKRRRWSSETGSDADSDIYY